ncbi:MAG: SLC13 family permease, partial [Alphaproteobacteria bacterium]
SEASKVAGQWLPDVETLLGEKDVEILSIVRGKHTVLNTGSWERITPGDVLVLRAGADDLADLVSEWSLELVGQADADQAPTEEAVNEDSQDPDATTGADNGAEAVAETDPAGDNHKESAAIAAAASIAGGASPLAPIAASGAPATDSPETDADKGTSSDDVIMTEAVVMPGAAIEHRSAAGVDLRARYGVNLIAVSRRGRAIHQRLRSLPIAAGDILLLQGADERVFDTISALGCVPLAERRLRLGGRQTALQASAIFIAGIAAAAMGFVPVAVGFGAVALAFVLLRVVPLRQLYTSIDWPVIILLGALIPVGQAVQTTGLADLVAGSVQLGLGGLSGQSGLIVAILILMAVTMTLSDLMNNAATAVIMAPVAIALAAGLQVSPDALLMAVAVGASCAFLTPIGHQNNTLILGPGGYRFGDYWRMGLPLEILVLIVATPVIVLVWGG